jgi:hypothetical protein
VEEWGGKILIRKSKHGSGPSPDVQNQQTQVHIDMTIKNKERLLWHFSPESVSSERRAIADRADVARQEFLHL